MMKMMCSMLSPSQASPSDIERRRHRHMIRRQLPSAQVDVDMVTAEAATERRARQDVVEPAAAVGLAPVGVSIAPPRIELLALRHEAARHVDPVHRRHHPAEQVDLDRRMRDDLEELLVAPYVVL